MKWVLSWQSELNGEFNAMSPWIEQVELDLARRQAKRLDPASCRSGTKAIKAKLLAKMPQPTAQQALPAALSASGFCQFDDLSLSIFASPHFRSFGAR